jgi:DNA-binding protein
MSDNFRTKKNHVIVGSKPIMNYVVACLTLFNDGAKFILVRARGRHISKAVDSVELLRRVFIKDLAIRNIKIGTDILTREDGKKANVSTIEMRLKKSLNSYTLSP